MKLAPKTLYSVDSSRPAEKALATKGGIEATAPRSAESKTSLPDDVLRYIVGSGRLNPPDLVRLERVSTGMQAIAGSESVWRLVAPRASRTKKESAEGLPQLRRLGPTAKAFHQRMRNQPAEEKAMFRRAYDDGDPFPLPSARSPDFRSDPRHVLLDDFDFLRAAAAGEKNSFIKRGLVDASHRLRQDLAFTLSLLLLAWNHEPAIPQVLDTKLGYRAACSFNGPVEAVFGRVHLYVNYHVGRRVNLLANPTPDNLATLRMFAENWPADRSGDVPEVKLYRNVQAEQVEQFSATLTKRLKGTVWERDLSQSFVANLLRIGCDSHVKLDAMISAAQHRDDLASLDDMRNPSPWKKVLFVALDKQPFKLGYFSSQGGS